MDKILTGELNTVSLLAAIILGFLTKRIVPYWVYDDVVTKLKVYEQEAPELITEVRRLATSLREEREKTTKSPYRTVLVNKKRK